MFLSKETKIQLTTFLFHLLSTANWMSVVWIPWSLQSFVWIGSYISSLFSWINVCYESLHFRIHRTALAELDRSWQVSGHWHRWWVIRGCVFAVHSAITASRPLTFPHQRFKIFLKFCIFLWLGNAFFHGIKKRHLCPLEQYARAVILTAKGNRF